MNPNKLTTFFLLALFSGILSQVANAQIVYTDLNPDVTTSGTYNLDLNNDGTVDFIIQHISQSVSGSGKCKGRTNVNQYIRITPLNNNQVLDSGNNSKRMLPNDIIDGTVSSWSNQGNQLMISYVATCTYNCFFGQCGYYFLPATNGNWYAAPEDGFLGLRLNYGGHSYFGWAQINIPDGAGAFTIKAYGVNGNPDQAILAGQWSTEHLGISPLALGLYCAGSNFAISYIISGQFSPSNIVTAEVSDQAGSFVSPVAIGSVVTNSSGTINAVIPGLTPSGTGYRIRVISSNPVRTSYSTPLNAYLQGGLPDSGIVTWDPTNVCERGSVTLIATYSYPYGNLCASYQWKLNGNNIPGATADSYTATAPGKYTCVKTNGAGSVTSNMIIVTANPIPATIHAIPGPAVCGESVNLSNTGMAGTYQWKQNGNNIPGATADSYSPAVSGAYSCVVTNTCGSFASNTINVSIGPAMPGATIAAAGPTIICNGQVTLTANTATGLTYQWYTRNEWSGINTVVQGATGSSYVASTDGEYLVVETNAIGCTRTSNSILVLIGTPTVPTVEPLSGTVCKGSSVPLHVYYFNQALGYAVPPYSYQWFKNGVAIAGATTYYYMAGQQGTYTVRASAVGGCSSTSVPVILTNGSCNNATRVTSSTADESDNPIVKESKLKMMPNPASSTVKISFSVSTPSKIALTLYNTDGQLVKTIANENYIKGDHELTFDVRYLQAGIYVLKMQSPALVQTSKLIVVK